MKDENPLTVLSITRDHLIALKEAITHTNKITSKKRAQLLIELFNQMSFWDKKRQSLEWD